MHMLNAEVADKTLKVKVDHSTFANWNGAEQTRTIVITGDEMKWSNFEVLIGPKLKRRSEEILLSKHDLAFAAHISD